MNARVVPASDGAVENSENGASGKDQLRDAGNVEDDGDGVGEEGNGFEITVFFGRASDASAECSSQPWIEIDSVSVSIRNSIRRRKSVVLDGEANHFLTENFQTADAAERCVVDENVLGSSDARRREYHVISVKSAYFGTFSSVVAREKFF